MALTSSSLEQALWLLSLGGSVAVVVRLLLSRLAGVFRFFFALCAFSAVRHLVMSTMHPNTQLYGWAWMTTEPLVLLLWVLTVFELYSLVLANYRGIRTVGRWVLSGALGVASIITLGSMIPDLSQAIPPSYLVRYVTLVGRAVMSVLAILVMLVTAFVLWFPIPLPRNVSAHCIVLFFYSLSKAFILLTLNVLGPSATRKINLGALAISVACLAAWTVLLNRDGQQVRLKLGAVWRAADEQRLLGQLRAINEFLANARGEGGR